MLLSVTGASGVGKSTTLGPLTLAFEDQPVTCAEFDSIGVPEDADAAWYHGALVYWVQRALKEQQAGRHLVLCGQVPVGALLATPSADLLDGVASCLLHCSPSVRRQRLIARGKDPSTLHDHLAFGEWFYRHTLDPTHLPEVTRVPSPVPMRWERWEHWKAGDPRWASEIIETDDLTREQAAARVVEWVRAALAARCPNPLAGEPA